eukprot:13090495-Alexandrium_andersonii.AAC.1
MDTSSSSAHTYYLQDWWSYEVVPLDDQKCSALNAAKREKEQRDEMRRTKKMGLGKSKSKEKTPEEQEEDDEDEDEEMPAPNSSGSA